MENLANTTKYWVYEILRYCISSASQGYFRHIAILNKDRVPQDGPVFFICNHPNALSDPIIAACNSERQVYFLTRGDLFKKPLVNWIFRSLKMLPIYRQKDGGNTIERNAPTFAETADILQHGGCAIIFPEAVMDKRRSLRPFKTGAARIALDVQSRFGTEKKLTIQPVSVTYRRPYDVGHDFVLQYGEPFYCDDLLEEHLQNPDNAFEQLTARMYEVIKSMALHMPLDEQYEARVACYDLFVRCVLPQPNNSEELAANWPQEKAFCDKLATKQFDEDAESIAGALKDWLQRGEELGVPKEVAFDEPPTALRLWAEAIGLALTAPLAGVSWLQNVTGLEIRNYFLRKVRDREFFPSVTFFCACLVTPATYLVQSLGVTLIFGPLIGISYLALCPLSFFVWYKHREKRRQWKLSKVLYDAKEKGRETFLSWKSELSHLVRRVSDLASD